MAHLYSARGYRTTLSQGSIGEISIMMMHQCGWSCIKWNSSIAWNIQHSSICWPSATWASSSNYWYEIHNRLLYPPGSQIPVQTMKSINPKPNFTVIGIQSGIAGFMAVFVKTNSWRYKSILAEKQEDLAANLLTTTAVKTNYCPRKASTYCLLLSSQKARLMHLMTTLPVILQRGIWTSGITVFVHIILNKPAKSRIQ